MGAKKKVDSKAVGESKSLEVIAKKPTNLMILNSPSNEKDRIRKMYEELQAYNKDKKAA